MTRIFKYTLPLVDKGEISVPKNIYLLSVKEQYNEIVLYGLILVSMLSFVFSLAMVLRYIQNKKRN